MGINKGYIAVGLIIAFAVFFELAAHADESDRASTITFNEPIQIPGQVLPAGSYLFKLIDSDTDRNIVQVFNTDRTVLYATLPTIATDRQEPAEDTMLTLARPEAGGPSVLVNWFYPGHETGNEFVYPKQTEKELATDKQETIVANQPAASNSDATGAGN